MDGPQRLLIVNRHFWPDVSTYSQMLRQIAARWVADGHSVEVLTAQPSYRPEARLTASRRQIDSGVEIFRVPLFPFKRLGLAARLVNSLPFFLGLIWHMLYQRLARGSYDYVLVATNPPILEALLARLLCVLLGGRVVYHLQDIHPDVEVAGGVIKRDGLIALLFWRLDNFVCAGAAACVTLSEDMRTELMLRRWRRAPPSITLINNFIFDLDAAVPLVPVELARQEDDFRVIFAGNIGFFQGLEQLVAAARLVAGMPMIHFLFVGQGIAVDHLKELAGPLLGKSVRFLPFQPMPLAHALVEDADLALITLKPGVVRLAYPSKTMTYAATGTPILAVVEEDSQLAHDIVGNDLGFVVPQGDAEQLADAIRKAYAARVQLRATRAVRKARGESFFGSGKALNAWSHLIADLSRGD